MPLQTDQGFSELGKSPTKQQRIAELMVRNGMACRGAAEKLEPPVILNPNEAEQLVARKSFQKILWGERHRFYKELEEDPQRTKKAAVGLLWLAAHKLSESGEWDKSAEVLFKLARIEGWMAGDAPQATVFGVLNAGDIERLKKSVGKMAKAPSEFGEV